MIRISNASVACLLYCRNSKNIILDTTSWRNGFWSCLNSLTRSNFCSIIYSYWKWPIRSNWRYLTNSNALSQCIAWNWPRIFSNSTLDLLSIIGPVQILSKPAGNYIKEIRIVISYLVSFSMVGSSTGSTKKMIYLNHSSWLPFCTPLQLS